MKFFYNSPKYLEYHFFKCAGSKLTASFLVITLLVLTSSAYIALKISNSYVDDLMAIEFSSTHDLQENFINQALESTRNWANHVAKSPVLREAFLFNDNARLAAYLNEHEGVNFVNTYWMLLDKDKNILYCSTNKHKNQVLNKHKMVHLAYSSLQTQSAIVHDKGAFFFISISPVFVSNTDKTLLGMAVVGKEINHQFVQKIKKKSTMDVAFIRDKTIMATTLKANNQRIKSIFAFDKYSDLLKQEGKIIKTHFLGKDYLVSSRKLLQMDKNTQGSLLLLKPHHNNEYNEQGLLLKFIYLALGAFGVIAVFSFRITQNFIRPIHQLIDTTLRISQGETGLKINEAHLKDDLSILAKNFNFMIDKLEDHNHNLEAKILERTQELRILTVAVEQSPLSIEITDLKNKLIYVNPCFCEVTGYSSEEVLGRNPRLLQSGLTNKSVYKDLWKTLSTGLPWRGELINKRKNGEFYWERVTIAPILNSEGKTVNYVAVKEDITLYKKTEEQNTRLGSVLENSLNEIYIVDIDSFAFVQVNKGGRNNLGYSLEELKQLSPIDILPDSNLESFKELVEPLYKKALPYLIFKTQYQRKNGSTYPVEIHLQLIEAESSSVFVAMVQDISERNKKEQELKQAKAEAEKASLAKSQFVANMSHELRTPLNAILGFSQLMVKGENLTKKQRENLKIINNSGDYLLRLINDVLDISKIESGQVELHAINFNLCDLLKELTLLFEEKLFKKQLNFIVDYKETFQCHIYTDKTKLRQVFINLINNAIKFTDDGGNIVLSIYYQKVSAKNLKLYVEIEDTGCGIEEKELPFVFQQFVQTSSGIKSHEGTGLGLAISTQFVQLMGGEMSVESQVDKGSVFKFNILVSYSDDVLKKSSEVPLEVIGLEKSLKGNRILIADDNDINRLLLVKILSPLGFELKEAKNGEQAVKLWEDWQPHIVLMDMRMPVLNGYEACRQIKAQSSQAIIIAVTASVFEEKRKLMLEAGCNDVISKPFKSANLLAIIKKYLAIDYRYEKTQADEPLQTKDLKSAFLQLDNELQNNLKQAIEQVDMQQLKELLNQVERQNLELANQIKTYVDNFDYEILLGLLK